MTNEVQVFNFEQMNVRTAEIDGEVWFVAADVAAALEIKNTTDALKRLDDDERARFNLGRQGEANVISEAGLYRFIGASRKPESKRFTRWVTHEVLPSIRKTGSYQAKQMTEMEIVAATANKLVQQEKQLTQIAERQNTTEMQVAELKNEFGLPAKVAGKLKKLGASRVYFWLGGKDTNAYREVSTKVFSEMWRDFKNHFGELDSYKSLPMDQLQEGRDYIRNWRPSTNTVMDIERLNAQTELEV